MDTPQEFLTAQEASMHAMLRQVLQNHITLHGLAPWTAVRAGTTILRQILLDGWEAGEAREWLEDNYQWFPVWAKNYLHARQETPGLQAAPGAAGLDEDSDDATEAQARELTHCLCALLTEVAAEQSLTYPAAFRVVLSLTADALALFQRVNEDTLDGAPGVIGGKFAVSIVKNPVAPLQV